MSRLRAHVVGAMAIASLLAACEDTPKTPAKNRLAECEAAAIRLGYSDGILTYIGPTAPEEVGRRKGTICTTTGLVTFFVDDETGATQILAEGSTGT